MHKVALRAKIYKFLKLQATGQVVQYYHILFSSGTLYYYNEIAALSLRTPHNNNHEQFRTTKLRKFNKYDC